MKNLILLVFFAFANLVPGLRAQQLVRQFPFSASHGMHINHSTSDNAGNILVCGYFTGNSASLNGYPLQAARPLTGGNKAFRITAFVAKLSPSGTVKWAIPFHQNRFFLKYWEGDTLDEWDLQSYLPPILSFDKVMVNTQNDVFLVGHCEGDSLFWGGNVLPFDILGLWAWPIVHNSYHLRKVLCTRISSSGEVNWVRALETPIRSDDASLRYHHLTVLDAAMYGSTLSLLVEGRVSKSYPAGFSTNPQPGLRFISVQENGQFTGDNLVMPLAAAGANGYHGSDAYYPSHRKSTDKQQFFPIGVFDPNSGFFGQMFTGSVFKAENGQYVGKESFIDKSEFISNPDPTALRIFSVMQDPDSGLTISIGALRTTYTADSVKLFGTTIPTPKDSSIQTALTQCNLVHFSKQGCLDWVKPSYPVYHFTPGANGCYYALENKTQLGIPYSGSVSGVYPYELTASGIVETAYVPRGLFSLVKYDSRGEMIFRQPLPEFLPTDTSLVWNQYVGAWYYKDPNAPLSISRIVGDTITIAGGKSVCHYVDQTPNTAFSSTPPTCNPREFFRNTVTAIRPTSQKGEPELYPNPARQQLTLAGLGREVRSLPVQDALGRRFTLGVQQGKVDVSSLHPGVYFIRVQGTVKRFVKE